MSQPKTTTDYCWYLLPLLFVALSVVSCNNSDEIPFPEKEIGFSQPTTVPLKWDASKELKWDTSETGTVKFVTRKIDIEALPAEPFDTSGFKPLERLPEEVHVDLSALPSTDLQLDKLPARPLRFRTSILVLPQPVKTSAPLMQRDKPLSIYDFGPAQGFQSTGFASYLFKDKDGLVWIAAAGGLYRYDGEYLQTIIPLNSLPFINGINQDKLGRIWYICANGIGVIDMERSLQLFSDRVRSVGDNLNKLFTDSRGYLWVSNTYDKAISIIDPANSTFRDLDTKSGLSDSLVFEIIEDGEANLWISTFSKGVDIVDLSAGKIRHLTRAYGLSSDSLSAMVKDNFGRICIAEVHGLNIVDKKKSTILKYLQAQGLRRQYTFVVAVDKSNQFWRLSNNGIEVLNTNDNSVRKIGKSEGLPGIITVASFPDNTEKMWVSTIQGPGANMLNAIDHNAATALWFPSTEIICSYEDKSGNVWVASAKGIKIINSKRNKVRSLTKANGLSDDLVQLITDYDDKILVTTDGGLNFIDPVTKTMMSAGKKEGLLNDTIYCVIKDNDGNMWFSGPNNGINMLNQATKKVTRLTTNGGLSDNTILDIKKDNHDNIWLATLFSGVNMIDSRDGVIKYLNQVPGLKDTCNKVLLKDSNGRIWIGCNSGIYIADTKSQTLTNISVKNGLPDNQVVSLHEYNGLVVAGTNNQAVIIKAPASTADEWQISLIDKAYCLKKQASSWNSNYITRKGEYLWGDNGLTILSSIRPAVDTANTYITGISVMTQPQHFAAKPELLNKSDTIWAADTFYTSDSKAVVFPNADASLRWNSVNGPYNMPVNLSLSNDKNYLQFHFEKVKPGSTDSTWYSYILEGIDKNWSAVTANTFTENYLNLPPGNYTFKVVSKSRDSKWSKPAVLAFTIAPPWYKTWWAYTLFALILLGAVRGYIVYRSAKLKRENRILEERVALRTSQLQASMENLKATQAQLIQSEKMASLGELTAGIAHEIQNPLNFVNNFSEVSVELLEEMKAELKAGNDEEVIAIATDLEGNLQKINYHGKRADSIVKGMLQHSRASSGKREPTDINALADEYLRLSYHGLRAKDKSFNADFETHFDDKVGNVEVIKQDLGRVLLNLYNNAFYSIAEKKKQLGGSFMPMLSVQTKRLDHTIEIVVKDNGNGIPKKVLDKIYQPFFTTKPAGEGTGLGLSLSYDIVRAHGGEMTLETTEGEGATFIIHIPG